MSQPSSMHSDENVRVSGDFQLILERNVPSEIHSLNFVVLVRRDSLDQIFFVENFPEFGFSRQKSDSEFRFGFHFVLFYLETVENMFGKGIEQRAVLTAENLRSKEEINMIQLS